MNVARCLDHETLVDHVEGRLQPEAAEAVLQHLDECESCRKLATETLLASGLDRIAEGASALPTRNLDRYVVLRELGARAMGVVYEAYDPTLERKLALKLLRSEVSEKADDLRARLMREGQAMARLHHPNVVSVFDVGTFAG